MPRIARIVAPGVPHHITQRGNRRMQTFFCDDDYKAYIDLMADSCAKNGVEIWAYCLMTNHVHLVAVPQSEEGLCVGIGEAHRLYSRRINFREGWRGYLWQGRFSSYPMDERYLLAAVRYDELNPWQAGMVERPEDHRWSSARAHLAGKDDRLVKVAPMLDRVRDWKQFLETPISERERKLLRKLEKTGRPAGSAAFLARLEVELGRDLQPGLPGAKTLEEQRGLVSRAFVEELGREEETIRFSGHDTE